TVKAIVLAALVMLLYPMAVKKFYPQASYQQPFKAAVSQSAAAPIKTESLPAVSEAATLERATTPAVTLFENSFYKAEFSTLGGTIAALSFLGEKDRQAFTKTDFFSGDPRESGIFGVSVLHEKADLAETIFKMIRKGESVEFSYELPGEYQLVKTYVFRGNKPVIDLIVRIKNLSGREKHFPVTLNYGMSYEEGYQKNYGYYDAVAYADKLQTKDLSGLKKKGFSFPDPTVWSGFVKKYFALLVKPDSKIIEGSAKADKKNLWGQMTLEPLTVAAGSEGERSFLIYAGPQRYEALKSFGAGFEEVFSRGFFGLFKTGILAALKFLDQYTHNFGWALVILTFLIKLLFAPLTHLSYASMKKMQLLAPKMKAIQEHNKKDPAKSQKALMELYRRNKVNPMMGCLPMLIQIPVFIAMFKLLPEAIELHGAPFIGWIKDLSAPDHFMTLPFTVPFLGWNALNILPITMAISQVWYQKLMPSQPGSSPEQQTIMNIMPLFFGFICYNMPSGLTLYWTLQNVFSIVQQTFINRIVIVLHHEDQ
ncbi:MAG: membrane protein insertase YidC, partial [Candidatus Omnitrophica bacterium]|nr:membrane protein insertase YidC [Candidatus Omnitrophota bacterium]